MIKIIYGGTADMEVLSDNYRSYLIETAINNIKDALENGRIVCTIPFIERSDVLTKGKVIFSMTIDICPKEDIFDELQISHN